MNTITNVLISAALASGVAAQEISVPQPPPPAPHVHPGGEFKTGGGNDWFEKTQLNLGEFFDEEEAVGSIKFTNPRSDSHKITSLQPNCACAKAAVRLGDRSYVVGADKLLYRVTKKDGIEAKERVTHINVEPGQEGEVEVHVTMSGIRGPKDATINIQTSDEALPLMNLHFRAVGAQYFVVEPPDVNLNEMSWGDKREFEFRISSPLKKDFNLLSHEKLSKGMNVEFEKEMQDGRAVWHVRGTYGPEVEERDGGGPITFNTDVKDKNVTARVIAFIKGPLTVNPGGFVSLGHVRRGAGKRTEVTLSPNGDFDLQVEKLEIARLQGVKEGQRDFIKFSHHKEGNDVKVVIEVAKDMKPAYMNGLLKIHLNHPAAQMKEVMFNGFVR